MFGKLLGNRTADKQRTEKLKEERKKARAAIDALTKEISAQLSGTPHAGEILKALDIRPDIVHFYPSKAVIRQENDGTWLLARYYDAMRHAWDRETGLARQDAISKLIVFVRDWQAGNYPPGSFAAILERYKDDAVGMGKFLFEYHSTFSISEIAVPVRLNVYSQMAGVHDESETFIELFDANGHKMESLSIREPETYVISGVRRSEVELVVTYLKKALNISKS